MKKIFLALLLLMSFTTFYVSDKSAPLAATEELSNSELMSKTGITVGNYTVPSLPFGEDRPDLYTVRFRDPEQVGSWLGALHASQFIVEGHAFIDDESFWSKVKKDLPVELPLLYLIENGAGALFERDNGYDLIDSSFVMPLKNLPAKLIETQISEYLKAENLSEAELIFKLATSDAPDIAKEFSQFVSIDYDKSTEIRSVLGYLLIETTCPGYEWEEGIFACDDQSFARMAYYEDKRNDMGFIPINDFDSKDLQFKGNHQFPKIGNVRPPEFTPMNLKYFILDTYNLLTNQKTETPIKAYVEEAFVSYQTNILNNYGIRLKDEYRDQIFIEYQSDDNAMHPSETIGLFYKDTTLANNLVPLVFISRISEETWEEHDLESWLGPHEKFIKTGNHIFNWSLPGEHPYEPYGLHHPEAGEWLEIYNSIFEQLEPQKEDQSKTPLEWTPKENVDPNHTWTITFNDELDASTINEDNIYIQHNYQNITGRKISLNADKKSIKIEAPTDGYRLGETYTLYIDEVVRSNKNKQLEQPVKMKFTIKKEEIKWNDTWERQGLYDSGILDITNANEATFDFSINVSSGAHADGLSGQAIVKGKQAFYHSGWGCELTFTHQGDFIKVEQSDECSGIATSFGGQYTNQPTATPQSDLYDRGVFKSEAQDRAFQQLVGEDYEMFVESMQLITVNDAFDYEVKGQIVRGAVRGLFTIMEAIIIASDDGHYYGAVIIDGDTIHYYTTNSKYENQLPQSIVQWKERFDSYPVEYK